MTNLFALARRTLGVVSLVIAGGVPGCGGDGGGGSGTCTAGSGTGMLSITITGLPVGLAGAVAVGAEAVTGDRVLTLSAGPHDVTVSPVAEAAGSAFVRAAYGAQVTSSVACVRDGATTTLAVAYLPIPTSGKLWFGTSNAPEAATLLGFSASSLATTGTRAADRVTNTASSGGFAFDRNGNVWIVGGSPPLARYRANGFSTGGDKVPDVTIDGSVSFGDAIPGPSVVAFDPQGNLWVSVVSADRLVRFTPAQLEAGGTPTAAVQADGIRAPSGIAFDAVGNLWVAAQDGPSVMRIDAAHTTVSGTGADLTITAATPPPVIGTLGAPSGLAFDAAGALWVNFDGTIVKLTAADLAGTGTKMITPAIQIKTDVLSLPSGIAFDEGGGLWFAYAVTQIARLAPAQLAASGSVAPAIVVTSPDLGSGEWTALYPAPANLPLYHRLP